MRYDFKMCGFKSFWMIWDFKTPNNFFILKMLYHKIFAHDVSCFGFPFRVLNLNSYILTLLLQVSHFGILMLLGWSVWTKMVADANMVRTTSSSFEMSFWWGPVFSPLIRWWALWENFTSSAFSPSPPSFLKGLPTQRPGPSSPFDWA